jgi:prolyl oligopeptidase
MVRARWLLVLGLTFSLGFLPCLRSEDPKLPEKAAKKPVVDTYHGVKVTDDYQWLEDAKDPAVQKWFKAQNAYTQAVLGKISTRKQITARLKQLLEKQSPQYEKVTRGRKLIFAVKDDNLVYFESPEKADAAKTIVDPDEALPKKNATIDLFEPSPDDKLVAVSLSMEGSEEGTVLVFETRTGRMRSDAVPRVITSSGGSMAWKGDGSGFYYTRHCRGAECANQGDKCRQPVYFHKLGTASKEDVYVFGKDLPRLSGVALETSEDGKYLFAAVMQGTDEEMELHVLGPSGKWAKLCTTRDQIVGAKYGPKETLFLLCRRDAQRGKIMRLPLAKPDLAKAETIVPEGKGVIRDLAVTDSRMCVVEMLEGAARLRLFDFKGKEAKAPALKPMSSVGEMISLRGEDVLIENESYLTPPVWVRLNAATGKGKRTAMTSESDVDFSDCEVVREFAVSKDKTRVPLTIIRRKGLELNGRNPTLLMGYGGYGENEVPKYQASRRVWLEQGGVYAIAHPRGDGEYGEEWHKAGRLTKKQNAFDDFAACARHLIDRKYTSPEKLAIEGGSNGGLLVAAALTQHPKLFRAAVAHVGVYDMLRAERHPNGMYSVTEFGSVKDPEQFKALYAYSPYHRVKDGTEYPAIFLLTGQNDNRVPPHESWKMAARLQAAAAPGRPILLWTAPKSGHDTATPEALTQIVDVFAFLFHELGVKYQPPKPEPKKPVDKQEP